MGSGLKQDVIERDLSPAQGTGHPSRVLRPDRGGVEPKESTEAQAEMDQNGTYKYFIL
jgi:hypothetical protein